MIGSRPTLIANGPIIGPNYPLRQTHPIAETLLIRNGPPDKVLGMGVTPMTVKRNPGLLKEEVSRALCDKMYRYWTTWHGGCMAYKARVCRLDRVSQAVSVRLCSLLESISIIALALTAGHKLHYVCHSGRDATKSQSLVVSHNTRMLWVYRTGACSQMERT